MIPLTLRTVLGYESHASREVRCNVEEIGWWIRRCGSHLSPGGNTDDICSGLWMAQGAMHQGHEGPKRLESLHLCR
jgi:hypothetical protein